MFTLLGVMITGATLEAVGGAAVICGSIYETVRTISDFRKKKNYKNI